MYQHLKHEVEQQHITWKWLFQLFQETNKHLFLGYKPKLNFVFLCRNMRGHH